MTPEIKHLIRSYTVGFLLSLVITCLAFFVTKSYLASGEMTAPIILLIGLLALAAVQLLVQLLFFFHLGSETKPRLNTVSFLFMLMVVGIIGIGSLWIMYNLDYNMSTPEVEKYIQEEEGIQLNSEHDDSSQ
ncbi:MAG: cytochrome C oxidase subunit IV family protein [Candidatus Saccharimonadales bacterium]